MDRDPDARLLPLAGADNARDLGGLPTGGGGVTRRGRLFRAALIPELVPDDVELLVERVGLRTVVDLRTAGEVDAVSSRWADHAIEVVHCPVAIGRREPVADRIADYAEGYTAYLADGPEPIVCAVRTLIDSSAQPAMFHCAAGKDRTGVLSALLLGALDVPDETIIADYAQTVDALPAIIERLQALPPYQALRTTRLEDHIPEAETMRRFLDRLRADWGDATGWLQAHGVPDAELARFREAMIERR